VKQDQTFVVAPTRPGDKPSTHPIGPDPFAAPEWAKTALDRSAKFDEREEHRLLLTFYSYWQALHDLPDPKTKEIREQHEHVALEMMKVSRQIDAYRKEHPGR
jgi:hypothetical protein